MIEAFKKMWEKTWGPRMEHILRNVFLTLLEQPKANFSDIRKLFDDPYFRDQAVRNLTNPEVRDFWLKEYAGLTPRYRAELTSPIRNKVGAFLADPTMYRVMVEPKQSIDVRKIMDQGKILLVNLAKGKLGSDSSSLLGAFLVSRIGMAALSRADQPEDSRRDFYLYLDEFQNFTTLSTANMLSELRKYRLSMILAHQYLDQVDEKVRDAILGNVGNLISFRVGVKDARILKMIFDHGYTEDDFPIRKSGSVGPPVPGAPGLPVPTPQNGR